MGCEWGESCNKQSVSSPELPKARAMRLTPAFRPELGCCSWTHSAYAAGSSGNKGRFA